jgi:hypothetical protein
MDRQEKRPRSSDRHISGWPAILLAPLLLPVAVVAGLFSKPKKRTPAEVAGFIRDFLECAGGDWDWDDFTSVRIENPELETIRHAADMIPLPINDEARERLKALLAKAEGLKAAWIEAGQPD